MQLDTLNTALAEVALGRPIQRIESPLTTRSSSPCLSLLSVWPTRASSLHPEEVFAMRRFYRRNHRRPIGTCRQLARRARQKLAGAQSTLIGVKNTAGHRTIIAACGDGDIDASLAICVRMLGVGNVPSGTMDGRVNRGSAKIAASLARYYKGERFSSRMLPDQTHGARLHRPSLRVACPHRADGLIAQIEATSPPESAERLDRPQSDRNSSNGHTIRQHTIRNRAVIFFAASDSLRTNDCLTRPGRNTGRPHSSPVAPVLINGTRYLVQAYPNLTGSRMPAQPDTAR